MNIFAAILLIIFAFAAGEQIGNRGYLHSHVERR